MFDLIEHFTKLESAIKAPLKPTLNELKQFYIPIL